MDVATETPAPVDQVVQPTYVDRGSEVAPPIEEPDVVGDAQEGGVDGVREIDPEAVVSPPESKAGFWRLSPWTESWYPYIVFHVEQMAEWVPAACLCAYAYGWADKSDRIKRRAQLALLAYSLLFAGLWWFPKPPIPDLEAMIERECREAEVDKELVSYLLLQSAFAPKDHKRVLELSRKAAQWMHQHRKNWAQSVQYSQMTRAVGVAIRASAGETSLLDSLLTKRVLNSLNRVDGFARTGAIGYGRGLPNP